MLIKACQLLALYPTTCSWAILLHKVSSLCAIHSQLQICQFSQLHMAWSCAQRNTRWQKGLTATSIAGKPLLPSSRRYGEQP